MPPSLKHPALLRTIPLAAVGLAIVLMSLLMVSLFGRPFGRQTDSLSRRIPLDGVVLYASPADKAGMEQLMKALQPILQLNPDSTRAAVQDDERYELAVLKKPDGGLGWVQYSVRMEDNRPRFKMLSSDNQIAKIIKPERPADQTFSASTDYRQFIALKGFSNVLWMDSSILPQTPSMTDQMLTSLIKKHRAMAVSWDARGMHATFIKNQKSRSEDYTHGNIAWSDAPLLRIVSAHPASQLQSFLMMLDANLATGMRGILANIWTGNVSTNLSFNDALAQFMSTETMLEITAGSGSNAFAMSGEAATEQSAISLTRSVGSTLPGVTRSQIFSSAHSRTDIVAIEPVPSSIQQKEGWQTLTSGGMHMALDSKRFILSTSPALLETAMDASATLPTLPLDVADRSRLSAYGALNKEWMKGQIDRHFPFLNSSPSQLLHIIESALTHPQWQWGVVDHEEYVRLYVVGR